MGKSKTLEHNLTVGSPAKLIIAFVGACVASPFAWLLADMFLIPAFFYVVGKLDKIVNGAKETVA